MSGVCEVVSVLFEGPLLGVGSPGLGLGASWGRIGLNSWVRPCWGGGFRGEQTREAVSTEVFLESQNSSNQKSNFADQDGFQDQESKSTEEDWGQGEEFDSGQTVEHGKVFLDSFFVHCEREIITDVSYKN